MFIATKKIPFTICIVLTLVAGLSGMHALTAFAQTEPTEPTAPTADELELIEKVKRLKELVDKEEVKRKALEFKAIEKALRTETVEEIGEEPVEIAPEPEPPKDPKVDPSGGTEDKKPEDPAEEEADPKQDEEARAKIEAELKRQQEELDKQALESGLSTLKHFGIEDSRDGVHEYLKTLTPDADLKARITKLIGELGSNEYAVREQATRSLETMSLAAAVMLQDALHSNDAEVRWRARQIIDKGESSSNQLLQAVFDVVRLRKFENLTPELLTAVRLAEDEYVRDKGEKAILASATKSDFDTLAAALNDKVPSVRITAIKAMEAVGGDDAQPHLVKLSSDKDEEVRMAAVRLRASRGERASLPLLVDLLKADSLEVRHQANQTLRSLTGEKIVYVAYDTDENRNKAISQWSDWVTANAATAELNHPLVDTKIFLGRTLVTDYSRNRVIEFDVTGKQVWEQTVGAHPWGVVGLSNGHRLVACYSEHSVTEYNAEGKEVWKKTGLPGGPTSVEKLPNGRLLVACTDSQKVVEVDRTGKVVWEVTVSNRPVDAQRLSNGRTLLALQNSGQVVEIDREGKIVWKIDSLASPFGCSRLENGNTLICEMGRGSVVERSRDGKEVWSKTGLSSPYDAQRLENGNTLIIDSSGLLEVDRSGKEVSRQSIPSLSRLHRY